MNELEPMSAAVEALLAAERGAPPPPPEVAARVLTRVQGSLAAPVGAGAGAGAGVLGKLALVVVAVGAVGGALWLALGPETTAPSAPRRAAALVPAAAELESDGFPAARLPRAATPALAMPKTEAVEPVAARVAPAEPSAGAAATTAPNPAPVGVAVQPAVGPPVAPRSVLDPRLARPAARAAPPAATGGLAAEVALIDEARSALAAGRLSDALEAISRHARAFPTGQLSEERDILRVRVHGARGDVAATTAASATFRARYPASIHLAELPE